MVRTLLGRNSREGFAQIGINAQSPQTYAAGALLVNGARLTAIYEHYVLLERDGHVARLNVEGESPSQPRSEGVATDELLTVGGAPAAPAATVTSQERLTDYIKPSPVFVDGQLHGYALVEGRNAQAFSDLGLQSGDVITQINGAPVSASSNALEILKTLTEGEALSVTIEREGVPQSLSLDGALLKHSPPAPLVAPEDFSRRSAVL